MYSLARSILFRIEAETAHHIALKGLRTLERTPLRALFTQDIPADPVELWGLKFPHRVGLAAGLDKN